MKRPVLAAVVALAAWWSAGENAAQAQGWRLGTYGNSPFGQGSIFNNSQNQANQVNQNLAYMQQQGLLNVLNATNQLGPTTLATTGVSQTGHPVTYFNTQRYFPLNYGTSSGTSLGMSGITGTGGNYGFGPGTTGVGGIGGIGGTGGFGSGQGSGFITQNPFQNLGMPQRGRTGTGR